MLSYHRHISSTPTTSSSMHLSPLPTRLTLDCTHFRCWSPPNTLPGSGIREHFAFVYWLACFNFFQPHHHVYCHPSPSLHTNIYYPSHSPNSCGSGSPTRSCPRRYCAEFTMANMDRNPLGKTWRRRRYECGSRNPLRGRHWRWSSNKKIIRRIGGCINITSSTG